GTYDRNSGVWVPSIDGRVLKILSNSGTTVVLDVDGQGLPATPAELSALGVGSLELNELAALAYPAGKSRWRVPLTHFSPWDFNWGAGPPPGGAPPGGPCGESCSKSPPGNPDPPKQPPGKNPPCKEGGHSTLIPATRTMQEDLATADPNLSLHYESSRVVGRAGKNAVT